MYTLYFSNGNTQTYPDVATLKAAAKAMGGEAVSLNSSGLNKLYAFSPKK